MASDERSLQTGGAPTDAELMAAMTAGDGEALATLLHKYGRLVHRIAADILHDATEAEDVAQEVFLEVYNRAELYDPARGSVRGWLLQYAYHRAFRRKAALKTRAAYRGEPLDDTQRGEADDRRRHLTPDECRWTIRAGLDRLPTRQRLTLELACFEDLSLRDVANRLDISLGCARHYYYRGLARLQSWAQVDDAWTGARMHSARIVSGQTLSERSCRRRAEDDRADDARRRGRPQLVRA